MLSRGTGSDYTLYRENGEVLAVVEAKKTVIDVRLAEAQLTHYVTEVAKHQSFRPFGFLANGLDLEKLSYVDLSEKKFAQLKLERGDVIFNRTNSTELVGKTTYWNYDFDALIASYLVKLKLKKDRLPEFFVALLNMSHYKNMFQERCKKAVGQSNITRTLLKEFPMFVPTAEPARRVCGRGEVGRVAGGDDGRDHAAGGGVV
jgi:hypothetical protein